VKSEELYALLRRRGVLWPTAEIYGGAAGLYDYGPLGTALKDRIEGAWANWFVGLSDDYYLIEPAELLPEAVVRASGHLENFTDPEVVCGKCHNAFRAETVLEKWRPQGVDGLSTEQIGALLVEHRVKCPTCGASQLTAPRPFNLMFGLDFGVTGKERAYLRPETAQNSYLAFARMWDVGRRALPLGIAVIGRAYRNEIAPRQVLFRMRAFTQAELQIFFDPAEFGPQPPLGEEPLPVVRAANRIAGQEEVTPVAPGDLVASGLPSFYVTHLAHTYRFYRDILGYPPGSLRLLEKSDAERAFYNRIQFDVELRLESLGGYKELGAVHYRGDYDLNRHGSASGKGQSVPGAGNARVVPHVLELTFGVDRNLWALADAGLHKEADYIVWRLPPYLAPVSAAVFPLLKKEHADVARGVLHQLREADLTVVYDDAGSIGRRYARMDEAGTPFCVTIDGETVDPANAHHPTVTLRERDTKAQSRLPVPLVIDRIRHVTRIPRAPAVAA
jgi:glycyl-tRNA synthetase